MAFVGFEPTTSGSQSSNIQANAVKILHAVDQLKLPPYQFYLVQKSRQRYHAVFKLLRLNTGYNCKKESLETVVK